MVVAAFVECCAGLQGLINAVVVGVVVVAVADAAVVVGVVVVTVALFVAYLIVV